jgi:hypothetical protein
MSVYEEMESLLNGSPDYVLDSKYEIENVLLMIQEAEDKIKFFKELKQYRAKKIDEEINNLGERADRFRRVVLNTMTITEPSKKTLHFPGVGKVTRRAGKSSWKVNNEHLMLDFLNEQGVKNQVVETIEVVSKKEANKVFDCFKDQNMQIPGVEHVEASESISISFDDAPVTKTRKQVHQKELVEAIDELEI